MMALVLSVFAGCCGYSTHSLLPSHIRSVAVVPAENSTTQPDISEALTDSLVAAFKADRNLTLTDAASAQLLVSSTVSSYGRDPVAYVGDQTVNRYKVEIGASVTARDQVRDEDFFSGVISANVTYNPDSTPEVGLSSEETAQRRTVGKLAREIVRQVVTSW
jgi:hypothetical protein